MSRLGDAPTERLVPKALLLLCVTDTLSFKNISYDITRGVLSFERYTVGVVVVSEINGCILCWLRSWR